MYQLSEAFGKLYGQSKQVASSDTVEPSKPRGGVHENCITYYPLLPFCSSKADSYQLHID
jgi:hypothetical protein